MSLTYNQMSPVFKVYFGFMHLYYACPIGILRCHIISHEYPMNIIHYPIQSPVTINVPFVQNRIPKPDLNDTVHLWGGVEKKSLPLTCASPYFIPVNPIKSHWIPLYKWPSYLPWFRCLVFSFWQRQHDQTVASVSTRSSSAGEPLLWRSCRSVLLPTPNDNINNIICTV